MTTIRIGLLQMVGCGSNQAASRVKGEAFCRRAHGMGADIALFPEMWNIGYNFYDPSHPEGRQRWAAQAVGRDGSFVGHFRYLARELKMAIALTYLERWEGRPRNTVSLIDCRGEIVLTYAKVHTCEFDVECALTPGEEFPVCSLATERGDVKVGCMICYDREFPEAARILMLNGAELILVPNACTLSDLWMAQIMTRAYENMVGVALANYAAPQNNGRSCAFDAVAYAVIDGEEKDTLLVEAAELEDVYVADFDMDSIRAYREREVWGNAYRRPRLYRRLTDPDVRHPFVRPDSTR